MPYITPITDRTQDDIDNETAKGFFNVTDWSRIHNNTVTANVLINILLDITITQNTLTVPTITSIPTVSEINLFIENINLLRESSGLPSIPGLETLKDDWLAGRYAGAPTFAVVNSWERVLDLVYNSIAGSVEYAIHCGVATSGQIRFYQHRWRQYSWILPAASPVRRGRTGIAITGNGAMMTNKFRRYNP